MFTRNNQTYDFDKKLLTNIFEDSANPLNRISEIVTGDSKVLDVGAGNGILAHVLRYKHKNIVIDAIEPNAYAAEIAKPWYSTLYKGFVQDYVDQIVAADYDFIVLADVIEHLTDPLSFLKQLCSQLSSKTRIILSVPNVAFGAVRLSLLNGHFDYVDSGLLERTHLRFLTLETINKMSEKSGMNIEKKYLLQRDLFDTEIPVKRSLFNLFCLLKIYKDDLAMTYQFLLVLTKREVETEKKCFAGKIRHPFVSYFANNSVVRKLLRVK